MTNPLITMIIAYGPDGALGKDGGLPWPHHPEDMRRFREATMGHPVIMGRRTYDSLGRALKYRHNIVISSKKTVASDVDTAKNMDEALKIASHDDDIYIIGGGRVYRESLIYINRILLTQMHHRFDADTYFKVPFIEDWIEVAREDWSNGDPTQDCTFIEYRRRPNC